jgi:hypothetical protein
MFSSWTGLPKRTRKVFWTGDVKLGFTLPKTLLCDDWSEFMRNILYSDSKKCTVYVIDLLLNVTVSVTYAPINVNPQRGGGVRAYVGYLIINCIPTLGILISILAPSWGNLNRMTINIVFIAKWWGIWPIFIARWWGIWLKICSKNKMPHLCPTPPPPLWALGLNIDRCIIL